MKIDYHYCAITQVSSGTAFADGVISVDLPISGESIQSVRETIAKTMGVPPEKVNITSIARL